MFSGYVDVSDVDEPAGTRQMFYWFVESQSSPRDDPLMLWTNGGPGCSGIGGFLSENGPFRATEGGRSLRLNGFAWNRVANMVFIEQPVGVGFSFTTNDTLQYGDAQAADDNLRFILGFRSRFALYASSDFYLSSESYGGHYLPTLAHLIEQSESIPQFRGIFLGNPLTYSKWRSYGTYGTAWGHQIVPRPLWQSYEDLGCKEHFFSFADYLEGKRVFDDNDTAGLNASDIEELRQRVMQAKACNTVTNVMDLILKPLDQYALDFPVCLTDEALGRHERWTLRRALLRARAWGNEPQEPPYEPCSDDHVAAYLNREDVQAAIGVAPSADTNWTMCSQINYNEFDVDADMTPIWRDLIALGQLKILIYSGDDDTVCPTMGTQEFLWVGLQARPAARNWQPWRVAGQVAGFWTDFQVPGNGSFSFVTVHAAGHLVPATQPARSLSLLRRFLGLEPEEGGAPDFVV